MFCDTKNSSQGNVAEDHDRFILGVSCTQKIYVIQRLVFVCLLNPFPLLPLLPTHFSNIIYYFIYFFVSFILLWNFICCKFIILSYFIFFKIWSLMKFLWITFTLFSSDMLSKKFKQKQLRHFQWSSPLIQYIKTQFEIERRSCG